MSLLSKKLYRSNKDVRIAGVCAGIAEYFNIDASLVRIAWAFASIFFGGGIVVYIIACIVIPQRPFENEDKFKGKTIIIE